MTVKELIENLKILDQDSEIFISCEGGCVVDNEITLLVEDQKVYLEI